MKRALILLATIVCILAVSAQDCFKISSDEVCNKTPGCTFDRTFCWMCSQLTVDCDKHANCAARADGKTCKAKCHVANEDKTCNDVETCQWDDGANPKVCKDKIGPCSGDTVGACFVATGCGFNSKCHKCVDQPLAENKCNASSNCYIKGNTCAACDEIKEEANCTVDKTDYKCVWSVGAIGVRCVPHVPEGGSNSHSNNAASVYSALLLTAAGTAVAVLAY